MRAIPCGTTVAQGGTSLALLQIMCPRILQYFTHFFPNFTYNNSPFRFEDLYSGGSGIGSYGLMGNSWGFDGSQLNPPIMCPWTKITLGWVQPIPLITSGRYHIRASAEFPEIYIIEAGYPHGEYLLIENRQPLGFDANIDGGGGLAIWHIDKSVDFSNRPGFPGQQGWPQVGSAELLTRKNRICFLSSPILVT